MPSPRIKKIALARSVQRSTVPIYIVSEDHCVSFCNPALSAWVGQEESSLLGLECVYRAAETQIGGQQAKLGAGLCPPPMAFEGHYCQGFVTRGAPEKLQYRQASFCPLRETLSGSSLARVKQGQSSVLCIVHGPELSELELGPSDQLNPAELHLAIQQMQSESLSQINLEMVVGTSHHARRIRQQINVAASTTANVAVIGPVGSGRRIVAQLIHRGEPNRQAGPLIPIEGIMSDAEMVQNTVKDLYRHHKKNPAEALGRLLVADLDRMPVDAQQELVGFAKLPDFRLPVIATASKIPPDHASHVDTECSVIAELWSLVSTIVISIPSLSTRRDDIPFLAQAILEQLNSRNKKQLSGFDGQTIELLSRYSWPGELAELTSTIESAFLAAKSPLVVVADLPRHIDLTVKAKRVPQRSTEAIDLDRFLSHIESELIQRALSVAKGNKSRAAKLLGISRARLLRKSESLAQSDKHSDVD